MRSSFRLILIGVMTSSVEMIGWGAPALALPSAPIIEVLQGGVTQGLITPYSGSLTGAANYNYDIVDFGGLPINGPSSAQRKARLFFYNGTDGLHFNILLNTDGAGNGTADWTIAIGGNTADAIVQLSDDAPPQVSPSELREPSNDVFVGSWDYTARVDGGVIGPLAGSNWTITIDQLGYSSSNGRGINEVEAFDVTGTSLSLNINAGLDGRIQFRILPIPEPPTALLGVVAVCCLGGATRRRKIAALHHAACGKISS